MTPEYRILYNTTTNNWEAHSLPINNHSYVEIGRTPVDALVKLEAALERARPAMPNEFDNDVKTIRTLLDKWVIRFS